MIENMDHGDVESNARDAYDRMAEVYTDHVADEMTVPSLMRSLLDLFAAAVLEDQPVRVADVGCGPGHVTAYLTDRGLDIMGIDNSPRLLKMARAAHPDLSFEVGQLAALPLGTGSVQAVIAKHSLIHTPPHLIPAVLDEFARVLTPSGLLLVSFFAAEAASTHGDAFAHAVTTAYQLDLDFMAAALDTAGFTEELRAVRQPHEHERQLPHGAFFARRRPAALYLGNESRGKE